MQIDCYLSEHCGSYHQLRGNIAQALDELGLAAEVVYHTVYYDEAVAMGIAGSPTIRLNGKDLFESTGEPSIA